MNKKIEDKKKLDAKKTKPIVEESKFKKKEKS